MYTSSYLRFCSWPFSLASASTNPYAHLSNNSVQKHTGGFGASGMEGNMWRVEEFSEWLEAERERGAWEGLHYSKIEDRGLGVGFDTTTSSSFSSGPSGGGGGRVPPPPPRFTVPR